jgi:hypothetical protein
MAKAIHTHRIGPLCAAYQPWLEGRVLWPTCSHGSCYEMVYTRCFGCSEEAEV